MFQCPSLKVQIRTNITSRGLRSWVRVQTQILNCIKIKESLAFGHLVFTRPLHGFVKFCPELVSCGGGTAAVDWIGKRSSCSSQGSLEVGQSIVMFLHCCFIFLSKKNNLYDRTLIYIFMTLFL